MTWIARKNCRRSKCRMIDLNFICHTRLRWKLVTYKVKNWIRYYFQNLFRHSDWAPFVLCVFFSKLYTVYLQFTFALKHGRLSRSSLRQNPVDGGNGPWDKEPLGCGISFKRPAPFTISFSDSRVFSFTPYT